jgi:hypothetical protein
LVWLVGWPLGWFGLVGWLVGWVRWLLSGMLVGCLVVWLVGALVGLVRWLLGVYICCDWFVGRLGG